MFMDENFLLKGKTAQTLYHEVASRLPILDYHCHLPPAEIAGDRRFSSITEAWLGGDHYKWRLMRIAGVDESLITGQGDDFAKFEAFAKTLEKAIGNPVYHWAHLEMQRYFNIFEPLTAKNAKTLYDRMNEQIKAPSFSARGLIERSNVEAICTTDDPVDTLAHHRAIAADPIQGCTVRPTFRPDRAILIDRADFSEYVALLAQADGGEIASFANFLSVLESRVDFFHENGCRLSDHDFGVLPTVLGTESGAKAAFEKKQNGGALTKDEADGFKSFILAYLAGLFAKNGWVMQLHCGAMRNNSTKMFQKIGKDTGFDTMSDYEVAFCVSRLLDYMEQGPGLPQTVLYSLNPKDNYPMLALCGCFTGEGVAAKTQFGSAWWFADHREGMEKQLMDTANLNLLSAFVGMLTDSRSFLSYPRHEYFRRILCNLVGRLVDDGEFPADMSLLSPIIAGVSYENAKRFFRF